MMTIGITKISMKMKGSKMANKLSDRGSNRGHLKSESRSSEIWIIIASKTIVVMLLIQSVKDIGDNDDKCLGVVKLARKKEVGLKVLKSITAHKDKLILTFQEALLNRQVQAVLVVNFIKLRVRS